MSRAKARVTRAIASDDAVFPRRKKKSIGSARNARKTSATTGKITVLGSTAIAITVGAGSSIRSFCQVTAGSSADRVAVCEVSGSVTVAGMLVMPSGKDSQPIVTSCGVREVV